MPPPEFTGVVPAKKAPHGVATDFSTFFFKDAFKPETLLLLGAAAQIVLCALLPYRVAVLPGVLLLVRAAVSSAIQMSSVSSNTYLTDVIPGRTSAQLPYRDSGRFGSNPSAQPIVVFHFGVKFNHPLGVFSPGARETSAHFKKMNDDIIKRADEYGMLGASPWRAGERGSQNTYMMLYYFRDLEGLNKFAHDDIHRQGWEWIVKAGHKHIGFFHEAFCVPAKAYESIYVNLQPLLMGQTSVKCEDDEGQEEWVRPIVQADVGPLKSQFGRMGRAFKEYNESQVAPQV